ncbi:hypothetical protein BwSF21_14870 [Bradyrhizobium ottawaense]|nr:hypothetical protein BwSF21_14870 [Bradyrhizobium ottawaense]
MLRATAVMTIVAIIAPIVRTQSRQLQNPTIKIAKRAGAAASIPKKCKGCAVICIAVEKIEVWNSRKAAPKSGAVNASEVAARTPAARGDGNNPAKTVVTKIDVTNPPKSKERPVSTLATAAATRTMRCQGAASGKAMLATPAAAAIDANRRCDLVRENDI